jgi:hypothetical protein
MRQVFIAVLLHLCVMSFGQSDSLRHTVFNKSPRSIVPSYRYISNGNHQMGLLMTNTYFRELKPYDTALKYWAEPMYNFDKKMVGTGALSKKWLTKGVFQAIEPIVAIRRFPFFKNDNLNYVLDYYKGRISTKFYLKNEACNSKSITLSRIGIYEKFALFNSSTDYSFKQINTQINRLEYNTRNAEIESFGTSFYLKLDNVKYKNLLDEYSKFTRLDMSYLSFWEIGKHKFFKLSFYIGYFLQNDNRTVKSYSNEIVKGSIALAQQGFTDYAYDENFVARRSNVGIWDNQVSNINGGGFKFAPSINSSLGLTNDYAFAMNASVNLPGSGRTIHTSAYFDIGGYKQDNVKYLYSAGLSIGINKLIQFYIPVINSKDISRNYTDAKLSFFERISYKIRAVHHFTNKI